MYSGHAEAFLFINKDLKCSPVNELHNCNMSDTKGI